MDLPTLYQTSSLPSQRQVDALDSVLILTPLDLDKATWALLPYGDVLRRRLARRDAKPTATAPLVFELPNPRGTRVLLLGCARDLSSYQRLTAARKGVALALEHHPDSVAILAAALDPRLALRCAEAVVAALLARHGALPRFKTRNEVRRSLRHVRLFGLAERLDAKRLQAEAQGNFLARRLTKLPGNTLTPRRYRQEATKLAKTHGWQMEFLDIAALKRKKAGAFLAVVQGSGDKDAGVVHLRYQPANARGKRIALVGKGVCFDTGGVNLKSARSMQHMHEDMAGSAVALGTLLALTLLRVNFTIDCWLALAQNHIGPNAYKPGDVVSAANGTTIEIVHTDAEGRMVLADTLALAARGTPRLILDYATLTGACIYALGSRYSGAFTNRSQLAAPLIAAGRQSGERTWPFPNDQDFDDLLDSEVADVKQCTLEGEADHILAARFLGRFVPDAIPWIHFDLAAARHRGGLAHIPTDVTGFGVRLTLELLLNGHLDSIL